MNYRILIADDEKLECMVLEKMIRENGFAAEILPFAHDGAELVSRTEAYHPDIIIADINMPMLSGLHAVEMILSRFPEIKVVMVTAYSRFEYAQKALSLGASDYILKPVKEAELAASLRKVYHLLEKEDLTQKQQEDIRQIRSDYKSSVENEFISEIILGEMSVPCVQNFYSMFPRIETGACLLVVRCALPLEKTEWAAMCGAFSEYMDRACVCLGKQRQNILLIYLSLPSYLTASTCHPWIQECITCVLEQKPDLFKLIIGVSRICYSADELPSAFREAKLIAFGTDRPGIHFHIESGTSPENQIRTGFEECRASMLSGNYAEFPQKMETFLLSFPDSDRETFQNLKILVLYLFWSVLRRSSDSSNHNIRMYYLSCTYWTKIAKSETRRELLSSSKEICSHLEGDIKNVNYQKHIANSLRYLLQHYSEDISLDTVAENTQISSFYLSRLFRQELGYTFLEILTFIRISFAIDLLFTTGLSAQEISEQCGYLNTTYFYKLFKKQTGMTIGEMKKRIAAIPGDVLPSEKMDL